MAERKDKQKSQASQPVNPIRILPSSMNPVKPESSSHIVPFQGCSPIQVSNRFAPLGSTVSQICPNYQSALISSYDPFQVSSQLASQTPVNYKKGPPILPKVILIFLLLNQSMMISLIQLELQNITFLLIFTASPVTLPSQSNFTETFSLKLCPLKSSQLGIRKILIISFSIPFIFV